MTGCIIGSFRKYYDNIVSAIHIGKTTGYEIGRLVERKIPLYYKEPPVDIPLYVPEGSIIGVEEFVSYIEKNKQLPPYGEENNLITKKLLTDLENNKFHL